MVGYPVQHDTQWRYVKTFHACSTEYHFVDLAVVVLGLFDSTSCYFRSSGTRNIGAGCYHVNYYDNCHVRGFDLHSDLDLCSFDLFVIEFTNRILSFRHFSSDSDFVFKLFLMSSKRVFILHINPFNDDISDSSRRASSSTTLIALRCDFLPSSLEKALKPVPEVL